jgi:predicted dehydrogenase
MNSESLLVRERTWWRVLAARARRKMARQRPSRPVEPIKLGIIGLGNVAQWQHLPWLRAHPQEFRVTAVSDLDATRAKSAAREFGAAVASNSVDLARDSRVEAVLICTPPEFHAEAAAPALGAHKHVLAEKPLAHSIDEADRLWKCSRRVHGCVAMVNFTFRCRPEFQLAAEIIRAGTLGEVYQIWGSISQGRWFTASGRPSHERDDAAAWKYDFGGVLHDLAPHLIDLARWWLGDLQAVQAWTKQLRAKEAPTIASCGVNLAMQSGAAVQLLCSRLATGAKEQTLLEVNGAQGSLRFSGVGVELWTRDEPRWRRLMVPSDAPRPLERFARAIRRLPTEIPTFWDGYKTNEAIAAIERSAETGERVRLPLAVSAHASERESIHAVADGGSAFESTALLRKA